MNILSWLLPDSDGNIYGIPKGKDIAFENDWYLDSTCVSHICYKKEKIILKSPNEGMSL